MPRNVSGTYSLYSPGNPTVPSTVITTTWANNTLSDLATAMTDSLSRTGSGGMSAPLQLAAGSAAAPGLTWTAETTSGLYRNAVNDFRYSVSGTDAVRITNAGVSVGAATGGPQGVGTINAVGVYDDGVLLANQAGANPTATIGLTAVNGAATTFLRSDGAPALSQGISPTWSGNHIFSNPITMSAGGVGAPGIVPSGDPDTGMYSGGADDLRFAVGGALMLAIRSAAGGSTISRSPVLGVNGAAGTPSFAFESNPNTGMYRSNVDECAIATNGVRRGVFFNTGFQVDTGQLFLPAGLVGTPALTFTSDTNTGFYSAAADVIGVSVGGVQVGQWSTGVGGAFQGPNGSLSNPGISFLGDNNTGFLLNGTGDLRTSISGSLVFRYLAATSGGALVADYGGTMQPVGYRNVPQNLQSVNYTLVLADAGKHIHHASGAGAGDTYTIPANASVAYDIGTVLTFVNLDSNAVTIAITTDTMRLAGAGTTGSRTLAQYGIATAMKVAATEWIISGTNLT